MSAKVIWYRDAWWVRTHFAGTKKREKKIGPTKADKRRAEKIAEKINGALALGTFKPDPETARPLPFGAQLRSWHTGYSVTFTPRYQETSELLIERHLEPFFGAKDMREITEADLLDYIRAKVEAGHKPATILNALSIVRRVLNLAIRDGQIQQNPANGIGRLISKVARREDAEVQVVEAWTRKEAETLLSIAEDEDVRAFRHRHKKDRTPEARFAPLLRFLLSTGCRRGEALGLEWRDVDFERGRISIRRALTKGATVTSRAGRPARSRCRPRLAPRCSTSWPSAAAPPSRAAGRRCRRGCSARRTAGRWTSATSRGPGIASVAARRGQECAPSASTLRGTPPPPSRSRRGVRSGGWRSSSVTRTPSSPSASTPTRCRPKLGISPSPISVARPNEQSKAPLPPPKKKTRTSQSVAIRRRASRTRIKTKTPPAQLAEGVSKIWSGKRGSNPRPSAWEADALPTELFPRREQGGTAGVVRQDIDRTRMPCR